MQACLQMAEREQFIQVSLAVLVGVVANDLGG